MTPENMVASLCQATDLYKLTDKELGALVGHTTRQVKKWRKGELSLQEASLWADSLGYTLRFEKKKYAV